MKVNVGAVEAAQLLIDRFLPEESVLFVERLAQQSAVVDVAGTRPRMGTRTEGAPVMARSASGI